MKPRGDIWYRREACRLASQTLRATDVEDGYTPRLWSLVVFFEMYLREGSSGTVKAFGPPKPAKLKVAKARS